MIFIIPIVLNYPSSSKRHCCRPQNDRRHRPVSIRSVIKILVIILVTITVTFLFVRSSGPMVTKIPGRTEDNVYHSNDSKQSSYDQGKNNFSVSTPISTPKVIQSSDLGIIWPESTLTAIDDRSLKNHSEDVDPLHLTVANARQNHFVVGPSIDHQDESIKRNWYPANHKNDNDMPVDDNEDNQTVDRVAAVNGIYQDRLEI